jgi:ABC-type Mn2+/Zn2+ transport system permease subunit
MAVSVAIAVATVWVGLWLSYVRPSLPPSTSIIATGFTAWLAVEAAARRGVYGGDRPATGEERP